MPWCPADHRYAYDSIPVTIASPGVTAVISPD